MLKQSLLDKLTTLKLPGVKEALSSQIENPQYVELSFEDRLNLLLDHELLLRTERRLIRKLKQANFKENATIADLDISLQRGLDRSIVLSLAQCDWIRENNNVIITGATGVGKSYLSSALGHSACNFGFCVRYFRVSRLLNSIKLSIAEGSWSKFLYKLSKVDLIILDDWFRDPLTSDQVRNLLEIFDDRWKNGSVIIVSQVPLEKWHESLIDPTLADAILDRVIHNSFKIKMKGESMRKIKSKKLVNKHEV